jgi:hypothetical protein
MMVSNPLENICTPNTVTCPFAYLLAAEEDSRYYRLKNGTIIAGSCFERAENQYSYE